AWRHPRPRTEVRGVDLVAEGIHALERQASRRDAARIQLIDLLLFGDVDEREEVPADADVLRKDDVEHRGGCDRGVDGITALLEDAGACLRGERVGLDGGP